MERNKWSFQRSDLSSIMYYMSMSEVSEMEYILL
jgi:hypothetical protein